MKQRFSVWIDDEDKAELDRISAQTRIPVSSLVRHGIELAIGWYQEKEELIELGASVEVSER